MKTSHSVPARDLRRIGSSIRDHWVAHHSISSGESANLEVLKALPHLPGKRAMCRNGPGRGSCSYDFAMSS